MLVLVTGGGGRLGNVLVRRLIENGQNVRVLEPGPLAESLAGLDIEFMQGSVLDAGDVVRAVDGVDVVYHLAAKIDLSPSTLMVNIIGSFRVLRSILAAR